MSTTPNVPENSKTPTINPTTTGFPDCYVLVSIPPDGGAPSVEQGPGSVRIVLAELIE